MQSIETYADSNDKLRLLLQGSAGAGKTDFACGFPKPYIIDLDVNLGGVIRRRKAAGLPLPIGYDILDHDDKGAPVPMPQRYTRLAVCLAAAQADSKIETIIIDSATNLSDVMIAEVLRQQGKSEMSKREWGFFAILGRHFLSVLSAMRKHVVLIGHEKMEKNDKGEVIYPIKVAWPGQVGANIGVWFTNVWRCENKQEGFGASAKTVYSIRTSPNGQYELKNTLGLPVIFDGKWETIQAALTPSK